MMLILRLMLFTLLGVSVVYFALYVVTGQERFKRTGLRILQWTIGGALVFFGVLIFGEIF